jgi:hypothetical protein
MEPTWTESVSREFSEQISSRFSCAAVTVYAGKNAANTQYRPGDYDVVMATIADLQIVDEESLGWDQILEFRQDPDASRMLKKAPEPPLPAVAAR